MLKEILKTKSEILTEGEKVLIDKERKESKPFKSLG